MNLENKAWSFPEAFVRKVNPEKNSRSVLVYTDPRKTEDVAGLAIENGLMAQYLNSDIDEEVQKQLVIDFNSGKIPFLVSTLELANKYHLI